MSLRILTKRNHPALSRWALNPITSLFIRERSDMHSRGEGNVTIRHRLELRDHKQRNADSHSKLKEARNKLLHLQRKTAVLLTSRDFCSRT